MNTPYSDFKVGRIILEGSEVEPYVLRDFDGVAMFEIVEGQYRVERLREETTTVPHTHSG